MASQPFLNVFPTRMSSPPRLILLKLDNVFALCTPILPANFRRQRPTFLCVKVWSVRVVVWPIRSLHFEC